MDPLTIAGAVVGIIGSASKMVPMLVTFSTTIKDAPKLAQDILTELLEITSAAEMLQNYLLRTSKIPHSRKNMIQLQHLATVLSGCVMAYSELEPILNSLGAVPAQGAWNRTKWLFKQGDLRRIVQRLQNYKGSLSLVLNILQCDSIEEACASVARLGGLVEVALDSDTTLSYRSRIVTNSDDVNQSVTTMEDDPAVSLFNPTDHKNARQRDDDAVTVLSCISTGSRLAPEDCLPCWRELFDSAVYRRIYSLPRRFSLASSRCGSFLEPRSIASALSLGDVSNLSMVAINIRATDINNEECYWPQVDHQAMVPVARASAETAFFRIGPHPGRHAELHRLEIPQHNPERLAVGYRSINKLARPVFDAAPDESILYAGTKIELLDMRGMSNWSGMIPIAVSGPGEFIIGSIGDTKSLWSPNYLRVAELREEFEKAPDFGRTVLWSKYSVSDAIHFLRNYLSRLPDTLIPGIMYDEFDAAYSVELFNNCYRRINSWPPSDYLKHIELLLAALPELNKGVLLYLLALFAQISSLGTRSELLATQFIEGIYHMVQYGGLSDEERETISGKRKRREEMLTFLIDNAGHFVREVARSSHQLCHTSTK